MDASRLRLAVWHEEAHRTAGDAQLLVAGAAVVVLAPWNPALWWQLRRLRTAVEFDCDGRVLERGAPRHAYGSLLLDAGAGELRPSLHVAALFGNKSDLERRLTMIGRGMPRRGRFATAALGAAAVLAVALACEAAPPTEPMSEGRGEPVVYIDGVRPENPTAPLIQELDDGEGLPTRLRVREHAEGEPIVYVDGVRLEGRAAMTDLNPDAIGRIEIIKGGAAERLFGSDAAAGVIQIFLKEGVAPRRPVPK